MWLGINCKNLATTDINPQVPSIWAKGYIVDGCSQSEPSGNIYEIYIKCLCAFLKIRYLIINISPLLDGGRRSWDIIIVIIIFYVYKKPPAERLFDLLPGNMYHAGK